MAAELGVDLVELRRWKPARRRRPLLHGRDNARRPFPGAPRRRRPGRRLAARRRQPRQGGRGDAQGDADAQQGRGRAPPGRRRPLRGAQRHHRDGTGLGPGDRAARRRPDRRRRRPGRGPATRHRPGAVRHPHHLQPVDPHDGPRPGGGGRGPQEQRRRLRARPHRQRGRPGRGHRPGDRLVPLAPGRRSGRGRGRRRDRTPDPALGACRLLRRPGRQPGRGRAPAGGLDDHGHRDHPVRGAHLRPGTRRRAEPLRLQHPVRPGLRRRQPDAPGGRGRRGPRAGRDCAATGPAGDRERAGHARLPTHRAATDPERVLGCAEDAS